MSFDEFNDYVWKALLGGMAGASFGLGWIGALLGAHIMICSEYCIKTREFKKKELDKLKEK